MKCQAIRCHKPFVNNMHFPEPQYQQVFSWQESHPSSLKFHIMRNWIFTYAKLKSRILFTRISEYAGGKNKYICIHIWRKKMLMHISETHKHTSEWNHIIWNWMANSNICPFLSNSLYEFGENHAALLLPKFEVCMMNGAWCVARTFEFWALSRTSVRGAIWANKSLLNAFDKRPQQFRSTSTKLKITKVLFWISRC